MSQYAYVANTNDNTVSKIDLSTFTTVGSALAVGTKPTVVAIDPSNAYAYVTNWGDGTVTKIDLSTFATVGTALAVGTNPAGIAIDPSGTYAYVAIWGNNTVTKIDLSTFTTVGSALAVGGNGSYFIAIDPSGTYAYVTAYGSSTVTKIDLSTFTTVGSALAVGTTAYGIAIDSSGNYAYITENGSTSLQKVDLATFAVVGTGITIGSNGTGIVVDAADAFAYVCTTDGIYKIDLGTFSVAVVLSVLSGAWLAIDTDGSYIYVDSGNSIAKLDMATFSQVGSPVAVGNNPQSIAVDSLIAVESTVAATFTAALTSPVVIPPVQGTVAGSFAATNPAVLVEALPLSSVSASFLTQLSTSGGFAPPNVVPWLLPVAINDHPYLMDFAKSRITTMQVRRMASDQSVEPGEQCVDTDTEILTTRGWLRYDEVQVGDTALTLNMDTGLSEWGTVYDVTTYERHDYPMLRLQGRHHSSLSNLEHRWPSERKVDHGKKGFKKELTIRRSRELSSHDNFVVAADCANLPTEPKFSDELVELVAWYWTEGNVTLDWRKEKPRRVTIAQCPKANPEKVERIRATLTRMYGAPGESAPWYEYSNPSNGVSLFHIKRGYFDEILDAAPGHDKIVRPDWIACLTKAQLELFIDVSIQGDGWMQGKHRAITQKVKARMDSFQIACVLAGYRNGLIKTAAPNSAQGFAWKVSLSNIRRRVSPIAAALKKREVRISNRQMVREAATAEIIKYDGIIWCPTTTNSTWLARRDGTVYFTGNTLSAAGVWPRAQDNWFLGEGQEFLDNRFAFESVYVHSGEYPSVRTRYWKGMGINPWSEGKLSLQPEYASIATSTSNLRIVVCGNYLYKTDGVSLYWTLNPVGTASPAWTQVTTANTHTITSLTTDGARVWFACGADGVYVTAAGTTTATAAATPAALANPGGLLLYSSGAGTLGSYLTAGAVTYAVSKIDAFGNETAATTATITVGTTPVNINWNPDPSASNFNVYRGSTLVYTGDTPSFVDDGTVAGVAGSVPSVNNTGTTPYKATWIFYGKGHLLGSTGRDLVEILADGTITFIFQHTNPSFVWTCATECPTAILVGGFVGSLSFVGAIQPDATNAGATLAPPTWATAMTNGEQINDIQYDAGAILMGTSLGIRSGTRPDSTGAFDVNPVIEQPGSVMSVASWSQYMYFGWSNVDTTENWLTRPVVSGVGRADLSQYTTPGVPAYATDVMGVTDGTTTQVVVIGGIPYFVVDNAGNYALYGPDNKVVASGWMETGWIRYGTLESKILVEVDFQHEPLPAGASVNYQVISETTTVVTDIATNSTVGTTTLTQPENAGLMEGDRYMPIITLNATPAQDKGPVFHSHITKAMVTTKRQDEVMLALVWTESVQAINGSTWVQDCFNEYVYLKTLEGSGVVVNLTMGNLVKTAYIDQCLFEPTQEMTPQRDWFMGTMTVKLITLD